MNRRRYLAAEDFADALVLLLLRGELGEIYNVGSECEYTNLQIADMVAGNLGISGATNIDFIPDRPFNDFRYAVNCEKVKSLGWKRRRHLEDKIPELLSWYRENITRYDEMFEMKSNPCVTA